ncbi:MAG: ABC transporter permease [Candidatus Bipolaricaulota bacterium]|nr:ABC transporter permease [Candidatus Bipolaricaulota bacterium]
MREGRLLRGVHRTHTGVHPALESVLAAILGLLVGAVIMLLWGYDPWQAYWALLKGAFGGFGYEIPTSVARGVPLILTALTFSICLRAGMFNIGAEGQMYVGAAAAVTVAYLRLPYPWHLLVGVLLAAAAGAIWSLGPALLKLTRGVSEVISTIMFNWISRFLVFYLVAYVLVDPRQAQRTVRIPFSARFPILVPGTDLSAAVYMALGFALLVYFLLWHTAVGYEVRAAGLNPTAARYGGISIRRTVLLSFALGGVAAGLAGAATTMGLPPTYAIISGLPDLMNLGFDGMAVAMVGRNHPIGILFAALFFGGLNAGGRVMQFYGENPVPLEMVRVVMGTIVLAMAIPELVRIFPALVRAGRALVRRAGPAQGEEA